MKAKVILVVDDDADLQSLITAFLAHEGYVEIEPDPANPRYIITVSGLGYKFNPYGSM